VCVCERERERERERESDESDRKRVCLRKRVQSQYSGRTYPRRNDRRIARM